MNQDPKRPTHVRLFLIIALCCLVAVGLGIVGVSRIVREALVSIPATADARGTSTAQSSLDATETSEQRATTTRKAFEANATLEASAVVDATATAQAMWSEVFFDPFDSLDERNWLSGEVTDVYATIVFSLQDGKYRLDAVAHEDVHWRVLADVQVGSDFDLSVDVQKRSGLSSDTYGIVFRETNGDFYTFLINDIRQYWVSVKQSGRWYSVIMPQRTDAIEPRKVNTLRVVAEGNRFLFYINDQLVDEATDDTLSSGAVGLAIELLASHEAVFEFDNFTVSAPVASPSGSD